jgi:hypothetical protein
VFAGEAIGVAWNPFAISGCTSRNGSQNQGREKDEHYVQELLVNE